jgi:hypothetical protein
MTKFYPLFKTLFTVFAAAGIYQASAQNPTVVTNSNACEVVQDFNTTNGHFTSPDVYRNEDHPFYYSGPGPSGMYISSSQVIAAPVRYDLISPIYPNTALNGTAIVGFSYTAPAGTLYKITIYRPNVVSGGADIVAMTSEGAPVEGGINNWRELPGTSGTICLQLNDADLVTGQNFRYDFQFYAPSISAPVTFDNFALNSIAAAPLPVNFMGIVATQADNSINVRWDVADETNVEAYKLERSTDASNFTTVSTVPAQQKSVYGTTDYNTKSPVIYYRIQSKDNDGRIKYSGIIKVVNGSSFNNKVLVYPSPASNQITVQHTRLSAGSKITISTVDGRILKVITPPVGASNTMTDISNFSAGMYVIRIDQGNGKTETTNFVKQ